MKRSHLAVLLVVAALAIVALLAVGGGFGGAGDGDVEPEGPPGPRNALARSADRDGQDGGGSGAGPRRVLDEQPAAAGGVDADDETFGLRIVRDLGEGAGLEPVPGAVVRYRTAAEIEAEDWRDMERNKDRDHFDPEQASRRWARDAIADEHGVVALPRRTGRLAVFARAGEWVGQNSYLLRRGKPTVDATLELTRSRHLRIRTADHAGRGVPGVPIEIGWTTAREGFLTMPGMATDDRGVLEFRNANLLFRDGGRAIEELRTKALILGGPEIVEDVRLGVETEEVVLEVPALGYLDVAFATSDGEECGVLDSVRVTPLASARPPYFRHLTGATAYRVAAVVGMRFRVEAFLAGGESSMAREVDGPVREGDVVEVRFDVGAGAPVIVGSIDHSRLGADALFTVAITLGAGSEPDFRRYGPLRDDGAFACALPSSWVGRRAVPGRVVIFRNASRPWTARFELPDPVPRGSVAVGRLEIEPMTEIVGGSILVDGRRPDFALDLALQQQVEGKGGPRWRDAPSAWPLDHRGRFGFFGGQVPIGRLRLVVRSRAVLSVEPITVQAGQTGLVLELSTGGDATMPVAWDREALQVTGRLVPVAAGRVDLGYRASARLLSDHRDLRFRWQAVPPGDYRVDVLVRSDPEPVCSVPGLRVVAGESVEWPELDLAAHVDLARVRWVGAPEKARSTRGLLLLTQSHDANAAAAGFVDGLAAVEIRRGTTPSAVVIASGYHVATVTLQPGDQDVRLRPWSHVVDLRLDPDLLRRFPGVEWRALLRGPTGTLDEAVPERLREHFFGRFLDQREQQDGRFAVKFDAQGRARRSVPVRGPWTVQLLGRSASVTGKSGSFREQVATGLQADGAPITVTLTAEQVKEAAEWLR